MGGFNFKKRGLRAGWQLLLLQWLVPLLALAASSAAVADATLSKVFIPSTIGPGSVSTAVFTITNTGQTPVSGLAFTDTLPILPGDVDIATPANVSASCLDGVVDAPDGGGTISFSGGKVGVGETCVVAVDVTASTPGAHTNPAITLFYTELDGDPPTSLPVDLTVSTALPGFSKSFAPGSVPLGDRSTLTLTIDNTANPSALSSLVFTDNLPVGMVIADPANASTTCGGPNPLLTAEAGGDVVAFQSFGILFPGFEVLLAGQTCTVTVDVLATAAGPLDNVTSELATNAGSSGKASDTLEVTRTDLAITKAFTDDPTPPGATVTLAFTLHNFNRLEAATDIAFTDDLTTLLPALPGLVFDSELFNDCGGSVAGVGTSTIDFSGGILAAGASCSIRTSLAVPLGVEPGIYTNTTGTISATLGSDAVVGNMASDDLFVSPAPVLSKSFLTNPVNPGDTVVLEFTVTNTSATSSATDITFTDDFESIHPTASVTPGDGCCGAGSTCTYTPLFDPPPPSDVTPAKLSISGGTLAPAGKPGDSCTFSITLDVTDTASAGLYPNITSEIIATVDGATRTGRPASDTLEVISAPTLTKTFTDDPVAPGGSATLEFTLTYPADASGDATAIGFTDDLNAMGIAGFTVSGLPSVGEACDADGSGGNLGTGTLSESGGILTFADGTLSPGESCAFSVTLGVPAAATPGDYTNTTSDVNATVGDLTVTSAAASENLKVAGLVFSKEFLGDPAFPGEMTTIRFTIENISPTDEATSIAFTDDFGLVLPGVPDLVPTLPPAFDSCGGTATLIGAFLIYDGGTVAPGSTCTIELQATIPATTADGVYGNTTGNLTTIMDGQLLVMDPATDFLVVDSSRLSIIKAFIDDPVAPGNPVTLEFMLTNLDAEVAASAIGFTDDLGASLTGLTFDSVLFDDCGGTVSGEGTGMITVTGASLTAGGSCTLRVSLTVPDGASAGTYTNTTSGVTGDMSGFPITGDPASDNLEVVQLLTLSKSFDGPTTATGTATLTFTITNPGEYTASDLHFSDDLDAVVSGLIAVSLPPAPCGAGSSISGISFLTFTGGELPPEGGSCSFDVEVLVPVSVTAGNYPNTTSELFQSGLLVAEPATADLTIEPPPTFSKVFAPDTIFAGGSSTLTFTIDNSASALAASNLAFTDNLPAGMVIATPSVTSNSCAGTLTALAGTPTITLAGGSVGAGASCSMDVDVTSSTEGAYANTAGNLVSSSGSSGTASDTLTVTAAADLSVTKTDGVTSATPGGSVSYTIVVANAGPSADPSAILDDTFASPPLACNWTSIAAGGATGNTAAGAGDIAETLSLPAGSTVTYTADCNIDSDASGTLANTASITPSITDMDPGNNSATDSDTSLVPLADLAISKSDGVTSAVPGQTMLVYIIQASNNGLSDDPSVSVADTFPSSLNCSWTSAAAGGATGNTATGSGDIAETLSMPAGSSVTYTASCSIASDASGTLSNTATISGSVADPDTGNNSATDGDTVLDPEANLSVSKTNGATVVIPGRSLTYTIVAANAGPSADGSASVSDAFPAELNCSWTSAAAGGATGNTATGSGDIAETLSLPAGSSVTYTADCTLASDATGTLSNTATVSASVADPDSGNNSATDIDAINRVPGFTKVFLPDLIFLGEASTLTFTIDNSGSIVDAAALAFTDNLPVGIQVAIPPVTANSCGGSLGVISNGTVINFEGGTVGADSSCTIALDVTGTAAGSHLNTTGDLTSSLGNSGAASATLTVNPQSGFSKIFAPDSIGVGQNSTLSFVIDNSVSNITATGLAFTDNLPAGVLVATPAAASNSCGGTLTATAGSGIISLAGGTVGATESCTIAVDVTGTLAGSHLNTTGDLTSSLGNSGTASDTLTVNPQPGFSKEFGPDTIGTGQVSTLSFVIDNSGSSVAAEVLAFTDQLPAGVLVNTPPATANTCGGTLTADEGAGIVSLAGGLVGAGASCSISVDVTATDLGVLLNTTSELVSSLGSSSAATDTLNVIPTLTVAGVGGGSGTVTGPGIDCTVTGGLSSGDCSESVAVGTLITLTAAADPGSESPVWDGCDSVYGASGELCDITLSMDATVTVAFSADDGDGVPGATEDLVDNPDGAGYGDGNGDGTADRLQPHVTSLPDNTGVRLVTVANDTGKYQQDSFNVSPAPIDVPPGVSFPVGLLEFRVTGVPVGGTVEMSVYVPGGIQVNSYYKPNKQGTWVNVAKNITTVGNKTLITFDLTDGGEFDGDNLADANLLDPGAPAFEQSEPTPVPTMNVWGLLMLSTLLGLMLLWHGRRRLN